MAKLLSLRRLSSLIYHIRTLHPHPSCSLWITGTLPSGPDNCFGESDNRRGSFQCSVYDHRELHIDAIFRPKDPVGLVACICSQDVGDNGGRLFTRLHNLV